ncbi:MAG: hypothetical protein PSX80_10600, partial [bacterium]|nr:hypothetical protein [bacterium]
MPEALDRKAWLLVFVTAAVYFVSNPKPRHLYDYTFRVAGNLLHGSIGFTEKPPNWLNEFVPYEGLWYSVFPLGSVVSMVPFAFLKTLGLVTEMPAAIIYSLLAGAICLLLMEIGKLYDLPASRIVLIACGVLFGTFMWTNLTFGGAWQLALGFAMLGELGAIYFTVYDRRPLLAGAFFALAFGNRTEILLTAPVLMYLLARTAEPPASAGGETPARTHPPSHAGGSNRLRKLASFCVVPFILGVSTLVYNYVRFHSFTDFGYARIPGVLDEPWYNQGIFSVWYIPGQAWEMLLKPWEMT